MSRIRFVVGLLLFAVFLLDADERITSFVSDIVVHEDATLAVQEQITVVSKQDEIIHGIVREFPTQYKGEHGFSYVVDFAVRSVTHNGESSPFHIEAAVNGKRIYIGDQDTVIPPGKHTYVISYTVNREIGFFSDHDELYWNVTGTGWRLPIKKAEAHIQLPPGVAGKSIEVAGYTGPQDAQDKDYKYTINGNRITVETTKPLQKYEGLTIAVSFPKGFIVEPSTYQRVVWLLRDNLEWLLFLLGLLFYIVIFLIGYTIVRRANKPGTIIPLFYPPDGMTPSTVGYMKVMNFHEALLSTDLVDLAVRGFITIDYKPGVFFGGTYTLELKNKETPFAEQQGATPYDIQLLSSLFGRTEQITVSRKYAAEFEYALAACNLYTQSKVDPYIGDFKAFYYVMGTVSVVFFLTTVLLTGLNFVRLILLPFVIFWLFYKRKLYSIYTPQGRKVQDAIDGFQLYLTTAETERMNIIGTPPTRTPELYEKYLPYAMALGVEKQWTRQFSSVFTRLAAQGHPYAPLWYRGAPFRATTFASSLGTSFSKAIASASVAPGTSSGSRGSGSSGGGGGGGGGGGW